MRSETKRGFSEDHWVSFFQDAGPPLGAFFNFNVEDALNIEQLRRQPDDDWFIPEPNAASPPTADAADAAAVVDAAAAAPAEPWNSSETHREPAEGHASPMPHLQNPPPNLLPRRFVNQQVTAPSLSVLDYALYSSYGDEGGSGTAGARPHLKPRQAKRRRLRAEKRAEKQAEAGDPLKEVARKRIKLSLEQPIQLDADAWADYKERAPPLSAPASIPTISPSNIGAIAALPPAIADYVQQGLLLVQWDGSSSS
ncbi:hypothetical protein LshimejAT787_1600150 [Lyophyllum shimeji]|uniref:Uncharacterized protein n=1 Tax=Lyophyllum shimeji TaxID=47721 RepID=A0A9P3PW62_LYOSH|nr:hypothetical protein LshimejAT787_1600150 [Lyophyllum shimeji]